MSHTSLYNTWDKTGNGYWYIQQTNVNNLDIYICDVAYTFRKALPPRNKTYFFYSKRSNGWQLLGNGEVFFRKFVPWMAEFYGKVYPVKFM